MEEADMEVEVFNSGEASTPSPSPWSDLPPELLFQISRYLQSSYVDILRFRAVCPPWRSSVSIPLSGAHKTRPLLHPNLPIKIPSNPFPNMGNRRFYLTATTTFILQSVNGGPFGNSSSLLSVDEFNRGKLRFREPLSGLYRGIWAKESSSMSLDLLRFRVLVVSEDFTVRLLTVRPNASENGETEEVLEPPAFCNDSFAKTVLLSNPSHHAVVLLQEGMLGVIGLEPRIEWQVIPNAGDLKYDDIVKVTSKNLIFGVSSDGAAHLITFNYGTGSLDQVAITSPIVGGSPNKRRRLVADSSHDRIFLIETRPLQFKFAFTIYKLEIKMEERAEGLQKWEKVTDLGDQILFVDVDFSFCAAAQDFLGLTKDSHICHRGNCIIFTKGSFWRHEFDLEQKYFFSGPGTHMNIGMFCLEDDYAVGLLEPGYESLLLPPINWFLQNAKLS